MLRHRGPVPANYAKRDRLPSVTPIIGDAIHYTTWNGQGQRPAGAVDVLSANKALGRLRDGLPVFYETSEID